MHYSHVERFTMEIKRKPVNTTKYWFPFAILEDILEERYEKFK